MQYKIGIIGTGGSWNNTIPDPLLDIKGENFSLELLENRIVNFPFTHFDRSITSISYIETAIMAQDAGFDAIFINTFGDYGIDSIRSALKIVVVGAGESSISLSSNLAKNFSIVTLWPPKLNFIYHDRLLNSGQKNRCVSIRNVLNDETISEINSAADSISHMNSSNSPTIKDILKEIELAIKEDGAEVILLGCTCMAKVAGKISEAVKIPIIEPMRTGYKTTEMLLALGLMHSTYSFPQTNSSHVRHLNKILGGAEKVIASADTNFCILDDEK